MALEQFKLDIDVIILTECWLVAGIAIAQIPGYRSYYTLHTNNKAGGVVAFIRDDIFAMVQEPNHPIVQFKKNRKHTHICPYLEIE